MIRATLAQAQHFILQKNYLANNPAANITDLAKTLAGLPANPSSTPFLSAWARMKNFTPNALFSALNQNHTLIKSELMRTTPYIIPLEQFVTLHAATARQRKQAFNAQFRLWGIESNDEMERLGQIALNVLGDEPATLETITGRVSPKEVRELTQTSRGGRVTRTSNVALALRWLAAEGALGVSNQAPDWQQTDTPLYAPLNYWYPSLKLANAPTEAEAQKALVRDYIAAFGPVTEADISFWTGFGKSETARATGALSGETTLTMVAGIPGMLLSLKSQADALASAGEFAEPIINLLPANDPYTTAHRASRSRYFADPSLQRKVFSSSGEVKPTILLNGQIIGLWEWGEQLNWQLLTGVDPAVVSLIEARLEQTANFLQLDSTSQL